MLKIKPLCRLEAFLHEVNTVKRGMSGSEWNALFRRVFRSVLKIMGARMVLVGLAALAIAAAVSYIPKPQRVAFKVEAQAEPTMTAEATIALQEQMEIDTYGCVLHQEYEYPYDQMLADWSAEQIEGFRYHEISATCKAMGGELPAIVQAYAYIVCQQYGVDYETVFALIEQESYARYDAVGDDGKSKGLTQINEQFHKDRMKRLHITDLFNPFQNILCCIDYLAELQDGLPDTDTPEADLLATYNYGPNGVQTYLWDYGVHHYNYNTAILERAEALRNEAKGLDPRSEVI